MTTPTGNARPRAPRDPYGIGPVTGLIGPVIAVVALILISIVTINLMNGQLPFVHGGGSGSGANGGGDNGSQATPAPSNIVVVPSSEPEATLKGSIVYAKAGNIWIQTDTGAAQLTDGNNDSMPSFSSDGQWVYFIRVDDGTGKFGLNGGSRAWYDLETPILMRVHPDGSGEQPLLTGRYHSGNSNWFYWMREPTPTPDGKGVIVVSDGPNPTQSDIVLKRFDLKSKALTSLNLPESNGLGHQDPAWRSDGKQLLYVRNQRNGSQGAPQIYRLDTGTGKSRAVTGPGYLSPSYSPDGRFIAATKSDTVGTDVVILDGTGKEVLRITDDHHSFAPVWSPAGDAIAFLHLSGSGVDLQMVTLDDSTGNWQVTKTIDLTQVSGLDGASRPSWFIPPSELPAPSVGPSPSGGAASSPPAGSGSAPSPAASTAQ